MALYCTGEKADTLLRSKPSVFVVMLMYLVIPTLNFSFPPTIKATQGALTTGVEVSNTIRF